MGGYSITTEGKDQSVGVAVIVPCFNEEKAIGTVVSTFRSVLPNALIVVADNRSTDETASRARDAGALVVQESRRGKGYALRRLFADVDAECYLMVDGDDTYDPGAAPSLIERVTQDGFDMAIGSRVPPDGEDSYRPGHLLGNRALSWIFRVLFRLDLDDTLSGYRALSRRFVKSFPTGASGFEIEAELNAHAAFLNVPVCELPSAYRARAEGSESKLSTFGDGWRILRRNLALFRDARPALAFLILAIPWFAVGLALVLRPLVEFLDTGLVARFPSLIVGTALLLVGTLSIVAGIIMQRTALNRVEFCRLSYLSYPTSRLQARVDTQPSRGGPS